MSHYGLLAELVGSVTALGAASAAVRATFAGRARWQPPEEVVPSGVAKVAGVATSIGIAVLWAYRAALGTEWLAILAAFCAMLAVAALVTAVHINIHHAYYYPAKALEKNRKLGGATLTEEAAKIHRERGRTPQLLFEDAQGDKDLVWTRRSQARVSVASTLSFIVLIASGSCALSAAGLLVAAQVAAAMPS